MQAASSHPSHIPTLDGWRGLAVSLVVMAHAVPMLERMDHPLASALAKIFSRGGIGVDIFFAISGYLICSLLLSEEAKTGRIDVRAFYLRRFLRISPPLIAYVLTLACINQLPNTQILLAPLSNQEMVGSVFFFRNYLSDGPLYTGHLWSIAVEAHFYLLAPLLIGSLRTHKKRLQIFAALILFCVAARFIEASSLFNSNTKIEFRTECRLDALAYGAVWAALIHEHGKEKIRAWLKPLNIALLMCLCLVGVLAFTSMPITRTLVGFGIATLVVYAMLNSALHPQRMLESAPLKFIGHLSYSIYLWHGLFFTPTPSEGMPEILHHLPGALLATLLAAYLSHRYLEQPSIALAKKISTPHHHSHLRH